MVIDYSFLSKQKNITSLVNIDDISEDFVPGKFCKILSNGNVSSGEDILAGFAYGYVYQEAKKSTRTSVITLGEIDHIKNIPFIPGESVYCDSKGEIFGLNSDSLDLDPLPLGDPNGRYRKIGTAITSKSFLINRRKEQEFIFLSSLDRFYSVDTTLDLFSRIGNIKGNATINPGVAITVKSNDKDTWAILEIDGNLTMGENSSLYLIRTALVVRGNIDAASGSFIYSPNGGDGGRGGDGGASVGSHAARVLGASINGQQGSLGTAMPIEYAISGGRGKGGGGGGGGRIDSNSVAQSFANGGRGDGGGGGAGNIRIGNSLDRAGGNGGTSYLPSFGNGANGGVGSNGTTAVGAFAGGAGGGTQSGTTYEGSTGTGPTAEEDGHGNLVEDERISPGPIYVGIGANGTQALRAGDKAGDGCRGGWAPTIRSISANPFEGTQNVHFTIENVLANLWTLWPTATEFRPLPGFHIKSTNPDVANQWATQHGTDFLKVGDLFFNRPENAFPIAGGNNTRAISDSQSTNHTAYTIPGAGGGGGPGGGNARFSTGTVTNREWVTSPINLKHDDLIGQFTNANSVTVVTVISGGGGGAGAPGSPSGGAHLTLICFGEITAPNSFLRSGKGGRRAEQSFGGKGRFDAGNTLGGDDGANSKITSHGKTGNVYLMSFTYYPETIADVSETTTPSYSDGLPTLALPGQYVHIPFTNSSFNEIMTELKYFGLDRKRRFLL